MDAGANNAQQDLHVWAAHYAEATVLAHVEPALDGALVARDSDLVGQQVANFLNMLPMTMIVLVSRLHILDMICMHHLLPVMMLVIVRVLMSTFLT